MKRMGWVVLVLVAVLFVSCSKESSPGPAGPQGAAGATGAAGTPRRMYIERTGAGAYSPNGYAQWSYVTTLPWVPATNGVIVNFRGLSTTNTSGLGEGGVDTVIVSGTTVTVQGWVWEQYYPYTFWVPFDIIAYDTFNTVQFVDKTSSAFPGIRKSPAPNANTYLP